ncbi:monocarboxylate transporter 12-B-like isoform X2 [Argiope bruennichi]|uniref:monocarboxylate transporter 12-B-like isoform X2 n=1 Tax=Argiope bruennichi TaxID=94029 RepID=UPI00249515A0|nr:monocarboxylate transporter 12-B-like isoform X2 [Argiope bruennichi]
MQRTGPDSLRSWLVVLYCSLISMLLYGVVRLSGIMFVASMEQFQVERQSASLPYVLCDFLQAMAGPITGFLSLKFGALQVMMLGSFIAAIGTGTCFFAQNIETVTVLWGGVYGLGFGLSSLLLPAIITQHFVKRRATAISLVYVGSYVGFSVLPTIADLLIHTYGLSGTYLFLSGFLLHCVPLSMLLRCPDTDLTYNNAETERSGTSSISIIGDYPPCTMKDSKCSLNDETYHDVRIGHSNSENEMNGKDSDALISENGNQYKSKQKDSKDRLSIKFLNCGDLQNIAKSSNIKQCKDGLRNESFVHDNTAKYNLKTEPEATDIANSEKETADMNQIMKHTLRTKSQSCLGRTNKGFNDENLKKFQNPQCTTEYFKSETKFKCIDDQVDYTKTTPKLLNYERTGSSSSIFLNPALKKCCTEFLYTKNIKHCDKRSNELFPVFINPVQSSVSEKDKSFLEHPIKIDNKTTANQNHTQMRRASTISKQELTISKGMTIFFEPIFLLVLFGNAVYASSFIAFITVIVDFSIDIGMLDSDGKFVIMVFSIASNVGLLSFGWVTDCGYLSVTNFAALMFLLRTITFSIIPYSSGFGMLMTVVALQGFFEASLANMFPLIVTEYYIDEIHELAISCTLFLCGPMYLGTPLLIGFFRDDLGSYLYLFLLMATMSLTCSVLHFMAPVLAKCRCGRDDWILRKSES